MDLTKTLDALDSMLAAPKTTDMTKDQFEAYAVDQVNKAKAEAKDDKKDEAKKRLTHLRATVASLAKAEVWEGGNGTAAIPEYDHGFEDTTRKTEVSETEVKTPLAGNTGTQGDGNPPFANPGDLNGKNPQTASGTTMLAEGTGTQGDNPGPFTSGVGKALADLKSVIGGIVKPVAKAAPAAAPAFQWPSDLTDKEYVKEGVAKRAPDHWGTDAEAVK